MLLGSPTRSPSLVNRRQAANMGTVPSLAATNRCQSGTVCRQRIRLSRHPRPFRAFPRLCARQVKAGVPRKVKRLASVQRNSITKSKKTPGASVSNATTIGAIHPLQPLSRARCQIGSFETPRRIPCYFQGLESYLNDRFSLRQRKSHQGATMG